MWTALAEGTIDHTRAQVIVDGADPTRRPDRGLLEASVDLRGQSPPTRPAATSRGCWSTTAPTWPTTTTTRNGPKPGTAATSRCSPGAHGMVDLSGYLPAGTAQILLSRPRSDRRHLRR